MSVFTRRTTTKEPTRRPTRNRYPRAYPRELGRVLKGSAEPARVGTYRFPRQSANL